MADRYCHWLARIFLVFHPNSVNYAVTLGQTAYFSCPSEAVDTAWHAHEDKHKEQYRRLGISGFLVRYFWYSARYGYARNPLEVEAEAARAAVT
jgi:hypothetical protein